jgi:hypothetical protein
MGPNPFALVPGLIPLAAIPAASAPQAQHEQERFAALLSSAAWNEAGQLWRSLDLAGQAGEAGTAPDWEKAVSFRTQADSCFTRLLAAADSAGEGREEILLLQRLFTLRIDQIYYGGISMLTRMMPPAPRVESDMVMTLFEERLDRLDSLRTAGLVSPAEYADAARSVLEAGAAGLLLDAMSAGNLYIFEYRDRSIEDVVPWEMVQLRLEELRSWAGAGDSLVAWQAEGVARATAAADSITARLPGLAILLGDLLTGD